MLREERENLYFNLCLENGFYMEAEDGKNIFQRLIDRIKALIEKIKKFINEKILKKEIPKEVEVDEGIMAHIKKGLGVIKKFLSNGFKFFATHKKIAAAVLAVVGIGTLVDLRNGRAVKIQRTSLNRLIKSCQDDIEACNKEIREIENGTDDLTKMYNSINEGLKKNNIDTQLDSKSAKDINDSKLKWLKPTIPTRKKQIKEAKEQLNSLPKYGSILYAIAGYIQKVLTYLGSKIGKSKTEKKGE